MAKVIRKQWVYKKGNHWYRYLPRRHEGPTEYDYQSHGAGPEHFPQKMEGEPPKLWLAWIHRDYVKQPYWTKRRVEELFGKNAEPGKMFVFKNTASQNEQLWHLKHLIEIRPLTFPQGEPTADDVHSLEVFADGRCVVDKKLELDPTDRHLCDPNKQMSSSYLCSRIRSRYNRCQDIFETNVYTPKNITLLE